MKKNNYTFTLLLCTLYPFQDLKSGPCFSKLVPKRAITGSENIKGSSQWPGYRVKNRVKQNLQMQRSFSLIAQTCNSTHRHSFSSSSTTKTKSK